MIVVVGVDDSIHGAAAARRAVRYAARVGAALHAVHVAYVPTSMLAALGSVPAPIGDFTAAQRLAVWDTVGAILDGATGIEVRRVELEGYPPDTLVEYADRVGADLLVVGSRGRGELAALFLGSTSHRVLHLAHCDVLVARAEEEA